MDGWWCERENERKMKTEVDEQIESLLCNRCLLPLMNYPDCKRNICYSTKEYLDFVCSDAVTFYSIFIGILFYYFSQPVL